MTDTLPTCPYCNNPSEPLTGAVLYAHRPDLHAKQFFACLPCQAWVGVHEKTGAPFGTLANSKLRKARSACHAVFDPLWQLPAKEEMLGERRPKKFGYFITKHRTIAYKWLAEKMGLQEKDCHIGMFTEEQCDQAIDIITTREPGSP